MIMKIVPGKGCYSSKYNCDTTSGCIGRCSYGYCRIFQSRKEIQVKTCDTKSLDRQLKLYNDMIRIRIGKFTDPGYESVESLKLLNWCKSNNIKPVFVTKLPGNEDIAKVITESDGVMQITLGYDDLEPGICEHNSTNDYRLMVGEAFIEKGYNIVFRLVRESTGNSDMYTKELIDKHRDRILFTPLRLKSKPAIQQLGGDDTKYTFHAGFYRPDIISNDYKNLKSCYENKDKLYCGKCLLNEC